MATNKKKATAYHEAGHALAYILLDRKFRYVTIKPDKECLGQLMPYFGKSKFDDFYHGARSFYDPLRLENHFKKDFLSLAGFAAEKIFSGKYQRNIYRNNSDYENWIERSLIDLPDKLNLSYQKFIRQYVIEILNCQLNWLRIVAIAEALIENETLTYMEVINVTQKAIKI